MFGFFPSHFSLGLFYSDGHFLSFNLFVQKSFKLSKQTKNQNIGKPFNFAMPREHGLEGRVAGFSGTGSSGSGARLSGSAWRGRRLIALRSGPKDRLSCPAAAQDPFQACWFQTETILLIRIQFDCCFSPSPQKRMQFHSSCSRASSA